MGPRVNPESLKALFDSMEAYGAMWRPNWKKSWADWKTKATALLMRIEAHSNSDVPGSRLTFSSEDQRILSAMGLSDVADAAVMETEVEHATPNRESERIPTELPATDEMLDYFAALSAPVKVSTLQPASGMTPTAPSLQGDRLSPPASKFQEPNQSFIASSSLGAPKSPTQPTSEGVLMSPTASTSLKSLLLPTASELQELQQSTIATTSLAAPMSPTPSTSQGALLSPTASTSQGALLLPTPSNFQEIQRSSVASISQGAPQSPTASTSQRDLLSPIASTSQEDRLFPTTSSLKEVSSHTASTSQGVQLSPPATASTVQGTPLSPIASTSQGVRPISRRRLLRRSTPVERFTSKLLDLEAYREGNIHERELERLRLESRRIDVEEKQIAILKHLSNIANNLTALLFQLKPSLSS